MTNQAPTSFEVPFVEKYRPVTLEDVVGNVVAIEQLKSIVQFGNMPNLILVVSELKTFFIQNFRDHPALARHQVSCVWQDKCSRKQ